MVVFLSSKLLTVCIYCFDLFPLLSKSFKMSLKENVGGYWLLCWHCSLLCSPPPMFHSPHSWCPSPPLGFSILCLSLSCFSTSLSHFSSGSSSLRVSYLPLLFEKIDMHVKGQSNATLHLAGFRQSLPASGVLKKCLSWGRGQWRAEF